MKRIVFLLIALLMVMIVCGQTTLQDSTLYKVERINYAGNTGSIGAILLYGDSVRVNILGSQVLPDSTDQMVNLKNLIVPAQDSTLIDTLGAYGFIIIPNYIFIQGAFDSAEIVGYRATSQGTFP